MEDENPTWVPACQEVTNWAEQFRNAVRLNTPPGRDQSLALTKIDEAEMWALRAL